MCLRKQSCRTLTLFVVAEPDEWSSHRALGWHRWQASQHKPGENTLPLMGCLGAPHTTWSDQAVVVLCHFLMHEFPDKARYDSITETCYLSSRSFLSSALRDEAIVAGQLFGYSFPMGFPSTHLCIAEAKHPIFSAVRFKNRSLFLLESLRELSVHPVFHNLLCLPVSLVWWIHGTTLNLGSETRDPLTQRS